ncbi:dTDP-4-amino-4,6-dideoxygalactose transaminase [compost metagenome]
MHNAHMFYLKVSDLDERTKLIIYLKSRSIHTVFHYVPLHSSQAGREYGQMNGEDNFTTKESERLIRLPLYFNISLDEIQSVINELNNFYEV